MDDLSLRSVQPLPELSLGSLNSSNSFSSTNFNDSMNNSSNPRSPTVSHLKASSSNSASISSPTTAASSAPIATPSNSPPHVPSSRLAKSTMVEATPMPIRRVISSGDEGDETALETPIRERPNPNAASNNQPRKSRPTGESKVPTSLTLREQEKTIDQLNKKIWSLQLKIHYLEERLDQSQPETHQAIARQNVALKIEVHTLETELKKCKKLTLRLEKELESVGSSVGREKELEKKLEEALKELRELKRGGGRRGVGNDSTVAALQQAEDRILDLEETVDAMESELNVARNQLDASTEELEHLREDLRHAPNGLRVTELEDQNEQLKDRLSDTEDLLARREEEREDLLDQVEGLHLQLEDIQRRREAEAVERSASRAEIYAQEEAREGLEGEMNHLRDRLARTTLDLEMKEEEVEERDRELRDIQEEYHELSMRRDDEWRGELEDAKIRIEELQDALSDREVELGQTSAHLNTVEAEMQELQNKFEEALAQIEDHTAQKEEDIQAANSEIQRLSDRLFEMEDQQECYREDTERWKDEMESETVRLEGTITALKEKLVGAKTELKSTSDLYEQCQGQIAAHRERQEELAKHINDLVDELTNAKEQYHQLQVEFDSAVRGHQEELRKERRSYDAKESALQSSLDDLARAQTALTRLQDDYDNLQRNHQDTKALGDSQIADRFSLQLEIDRLQRDVQRLEDDLRRTRKDLQDRESKIRDKEDALDRLYSDNRELKDQLTSQTQARLNLSEKLDIVQASLKTYENDLHGTKGKLNEAENALAKSQRGLAGSENQFRDQLTERNMLLLTVYQYLEKIVGLEKTGKGASSETKPFTNFTVFHDNLISRLKRLSQVQLDFDKRCKEAETRYVERMDTIKKQLDARWRQLDKFDASIGKIADQKAAWRRKFHEKDSELEIAKAAQADLSAQLHILRRAPQTDTTGMKAMTARAVNAEKRLTNVQNQLLATEERMHSMKDKTDNAENKWEARVKEYEARIRASEERVKRERQGGKERVAELDVANKALQKQYETSVKRIQQLQDIIEGSNRAVKS